MKTTKTFLLLLLLAAAGMVNAQCASYYATNQGGGTYQFTAVAPDTLTPVYNWTFDDGGTASGAVVQHTFTTNGMHSWCLAYQSVVCNTTICDSQYVNVCEYPVSVTHTEGDTVVSFSVSNVPAGSTYSWEFPDGIPSTSTSASPTIAFPGPGFHWGNLEITTPTGCVVHTNPSVNITIVQNTGPCTPWVQTSSGNFGQVSFIAFADSTPLTTYQWDFGDGTGSTQNNPQHTYTASGTYTYCVDYNGPNCTGTVCRTLEVDICTASTDMPYTVTDSTVSISVTGAPAGSTYAWTFQDAYTPTSTSAAPVVTFPGPGDYLVSVSITTPGGCTLTNSRIVQIVTGTCQAQTYVQGISGGNVQLFAIADSLGGPNVSYAWSFGDGGTANGQGVSHTYTASGFYTYCLTVTGNMCTNTVCDTLSIDVCQFNTGLYVASQSGYAATFAAYGAQPDWTYQWAFPAGTPSTSTDANPVITFPAYSIYNASVTVTTGAGCIKNTAQSFTLQDPCQIYISANQAAGGNYNFFAQVDSMQQQTTYTWDFGDGSTDTGQYVSHTYATSGAYFYCVAINGSLCSSTKCDSVFVDVCQFNTGFYIAGQSGTILTFTTYNPQPDWTYQWAFSAGTPSTSTDANPVITFPAYSSYSASVTITNGAGCVKNVVQSFTLQDPCQTYVTAANTFGGDYNFHAYTDSLPWLTTYTWDFGDGTTGTGAYPFHSYQANGTYIYCVNYSNSGCSGVICDTIVVDICDMNEAITVYLDGNTAYFDVYADSLGLWTYNWDFGAASPSTSTAVHPVVTLPGAGTYPVTVNYVAHNGCTGTLTYTIGIEAPAGQCDTGFTASYTPGDYYAYFNAADTTLPNNNYGWMFGDNNSGPYCCAYTYHHYNVASTYEVCLTVKAPGCIATNCKSIVITGPAPNLHLGGTVTKNGTPSSACYAQVYLITDSAGFLTAIDTFILNGDTGSCLGFYYFDNLPAGTYYTKAALLPADPGYADYMPTYGLQELNWADATAVILSTNPTYSADISLIPGSNPGGPGFVGGWVTQGAGLGIGGGVDESRAEGDPLAGIQINLLNSAGAPVGYTYSDGSGAFSFNNLALGTYSIYAEALNKVPVALNFTLTQNNPSISNIAIEINSNSAVGVGEIESMYVDGLMPNPTNSKATLAVTVKQNAEANLAVRDLTGRLIQDRKLQLAAGANNVTIDLTEQPVGVYYITLTGKNGNRVLKLVKTQ